MKHRMRSGRIITAEEWCEWRMAGKSNRQIANLLGITPAQVRNIARKFREAGFDDPLFGSRKPAPVRTLNTATDAGAYVLGILWGTTSRVLGGYWVRHQDRWYIEVIKKHLSISSSIHVVQSRTSHQFRLKIVRTSDVRTVESILKHHGWTARQAEERPYPSGEVHHKGFIRAWVELHGCADVWRTRKASYPRLRIYGNHILLAHMNQVIAASTGVSVRKLQKTPNEITKALYYIGRSYKAVVSWLYEGAELEHLQDVFETYL